MKGISFSLLISSRLKYETESASDNVPILDISDHKRPARCDFLSEPCHHQGSFSGSKHMEESHSSAAILDRLFLIDPQTECEFMGKLTPTSGLDRPRPELPSGPVNHWSKPNANCWSTKSLGSLLFTIAS